MDLRYEPNGIYKPWASVDATSRFPCCWGTLAEAFAKLADSIYFQTPDKTTLFINLFEASVCPSLCVILDVLVVPP